MLLNVVYPGGEVEGATFREEKFHTFGYGLGNFQFFTFFLIQSYSKDVVIINVSTIGTNLFRIELHNYFL